MQISSTNIRGPQDTPMFDSFRTYYEELEGKRGSSRLCRVFREDECTKLDSPEKQDGTFTSPRTKSAHNFLEVHHPGEQVTGVERRELAISATLSINLARGIGRAVITNKKQELLYSISKHLGLIDMKHLE